MNAASGEWITPRIHRGRIFTVSPYKVWATCGECGAGIDLIDLDISAAQELDTKGWKYTRESGWVCDKCAPLPRLAYDAPNRKHT